MRVESCNVQRKGQISACEPAGIWYLLYICVSYDLAVKSGYAQISHCGQFPEELTKPPNCQNWGGEDDCMTYLLDTVWYLK